MIVSVCFVYYCKYITNLSLLQGNAIRAHWKEEGSDSQEAL